METVHTTQMYLHRIANNYFNIQCECLDYGCNMPNNAVEIAFNQARTWLHNRVQKSERNNKVYNGEFKFHQNTPWGMMMFNEVI